MYKLSNVCCCLFLSLDQSSSEQVVDIVASRNFAAVQTASGKVGWEGGRMGENKGEVCKRWRKGRKEWGERKREKGDRGRVGERGRRKKEDG